MRQCTRHWWVCGIILATLAHPGCQSAPFRISLVVTPESEIGQDKLKEAQALKEKGLINEALAAFETALEENPKLLDAHMGIGDIHRERGDYDRASRSYQVAAQVAPNSFDAHFYSGLMSQLLGRVQAAIRSYLTAVAIRPTDYRANLNLASAYLQQGLAADALPYAQRAAQLQPAAQAAWANLAAAYSLLGKYSQAVDAYRQAVELGEMAQPLLLGLANAHIRLGNYDRAINVLLTLNRREPSAAAYERLGFAHFKMRRFDDALAHYRAALSIDAKDTAALNGLGACLMTMFLNSGRTQTAHRDEALKSWRQSIQIRSEQPRIIDLLTRYQRL